MLSREQVKHFVRFGYVIMPQAVSPQLLEQLRTVIAALGGEDSPV